MTRLSGTATAAALAGAALMSTSTAFSLNAVSSSRRCVRGRSACSASQQPSMVASVPRTVIETGTEAAPRQRLHVQVGSRVFSRVCRVLVVVSLRPVRMQQAHMTQCGVCTALRVSLHDSSTRKGHASVVEASVLGISRERAFVVYICSCMFRERTQKDQTRHACRVRTRPQANSCSLAATTVPRVAYRGYMICSRHPCVAS